MAALPPSHTALAAYLPSVVLVAGPVASCAALYFVLPALVSRRPILTLIHALAAITLAVWAPLKFLFGPNAAGGCATDRWVVACAWPLWIWTMLLRPIFNIYSTRRGVRTPEIVEKGELPCVSTKSRRSARSKLGNDVKQELAIEDGDQNGGFEKGRDRIDSDASDDVHGISLVEFDTLEDLAAHSSLRSVDYQHALLTDAAASTVPLMESLRSPPLPNAPPLTAITEEDETSVPPSRIASPLVTSNSISIVEESHHIDAMEISSFPNDGLGARDIHSPMSTVCESRVATPLPMVGSEGSDESPLADDLTPVAESRNLYSRPSKFGKTLETKSASIKKDENTVTNSGLTSNATSGLQTPLNGDGGSVLPEEATPPNKHVGQSGYRCTEEFRLIAMAFVMYLILHILPTILLDRLLPFKRRYFIVDPDLDERSASTSECLATFSMIPTFIWVGLAFIFGPLVYIFFRHWQKRASTASADSLKMKNMKESVVYHPTIAHEALVDRMPSLMTHASSGNTLRPESFQTRRGSPLNKRKLSSTNDENSLLVSEMASTLFVAFIGTCFIVAGIVCGTINYWSISSMTAKAISKGVPPIAETSWEERFMPWLVLVGFAWSVILCDLLWLIWPVLHVGLRKYRKKKEGVR